MGITQDTPSREPDPAPDFELLYERFRLPVYRVVRGIVLDASAAERLTQEAFERAYQARQRATRRGSEGTPRQSPEVSPQVWLYRIAVEVAVGHLQGRWWKRFRPDRLLASVRRPREETVRSSAERVLLSLSPRHRAVVVLSFYARLSNQEIAGSLQLPEPVVAVQLEFATEVMRAALSTTDQGGGRERL
jgi:RNA polymerase sigma factor (sigma-70 family)